MHSRLLRFPIFSLILLSAFLFGSCCLSVADIGFKAARAYASNANPNAIALGDFNGDGKLDLVVSNNFGGSNSENINVLLNNGDGTFAPPIGTTTDTIPSAVSVGDFNGDGKMDVVAADVSRNGVVVLLGNGNGTFAAPVFYSTGPYPVSIVVDDFNGDGKKDIAVATLNVNTISVLLGNGDGTLQPASNYLSGFSPESISSGDFNHDGKVDLVVANRSQQTVSMLLGNGAGNFQPAVPYFVVGGPFSLAVADMNGDGNLDIAAVDKDNGEVSILLGKGDGTFQNVTHYPAGSGSFSIAVADANGDGKADLLVLNATANNFGVLLGNGNGTFQAITFFSAGAPTMDFPPGGQIAAADFDGDGKVDIGVVNWGAVISILMGRGDGTFPAATSVATGASPSAVTQADFNLDGNLDFATANQGANSISVFLGNGNGGFANAISYPVGQSPSCIGSADFNGDGKSDLIVCNKSDDTISVLIGNGDGTFQPAVSYTVGNQPTAIAIADLNKDGKPDVITANESPTLVQGTLSVLLGRGDGTFNSALQLIAGASPISIAVADLNGDGNLDLAVANARNDVLSIFFGFGNGGFQPQFSTVESTGGNSVIAVDMNNDLRADLVVGSFGKVKVLINNGNGTFQVAALYPAGVPTIVTSADFDNDGKPDVLALSSSNSIALLRNNGDGTLKPALNFSSSQTPLAVAVADFNHDGVIDAIVVNRDTGNANVLLNSAGTLLSLVSSNNKSAFNQLVTISASILPIPGISGKPTGTLTIRDGATQLSSQALSNTGQVSFTTNSLVIGSHNLVASYSGDSNFVPRNSKALLQIVNRAPLELTLQSFPNPAIAGNDVSLTALLTPLFGGQPTGSIAFNDGATLLGTKALADSLQTSISTSAIAFGSRSITASYPGDGNYLPATSSPLAQDVLSQIAVSPVSVPFAAQILERSSRTSSITVTNRGSAPIAISNVTASASFYQVNDCGSFLASLQSCTVNVAFKPSSVGNVLGSLVITHSGAGGPSSVSLSGTGIDFVLSLTRSARPRRSATPGSPAAVDASLAIRGELPSAVTLECSGAPVGMQCRVTPDRVTEANALTSLKVNLAASASSGRMIRGISPGIYTVVLKAFVGDEVRTLPLQIEVPPDLPNGNPSRRLAIRR